MNPPQPPPSGTSGSRRTIPLRPVSRWISYPAKASKQSCPIIPTAGKRHRPRSHRDRTPLDSRPSRSPRSPMRIRRLHRVAKPRRRPNALSPDTTAENNLPATRPAAPASKLILSNLFRLQSLTVFNASLYYDPRIDATTPLSLDQIATTVNLDSEPGNYRFDIIIPSKPDFNLDLAGHADIDSMFISAIKMDLKTELGKENPKYLPPQLQVLLKPLNPEGTLHVTATGAVPLLASADADITTNIAVDNLKLTAGKYRFPFDQIRLPARYKSAQVQFLDPTSMGGPTITAFDGVANLIGDVTLNDRLDTDFPEIGWNASSGFDGRKDDRSQDGSRRRGPYGSAIDGCPDSRRRRRGRPAADNRPLSAASARPGCAILRTGRQLPEIHERSTLSWGSADLEITHARLAGLELLQGVSNLAKSAFADLFNHKDKDTKLHGNPQGERHGRLQFRQRSHLHHPASLRRRSARRRRQGIYHPRAGRRSLYNRRTDAKAGRHGLRRKLDQRGQ